MMIGYENHKISYISNDFWKGEASFYLSEFRSPSYDRIRMVEHRPLFTNLINDCSIDTLKKDNAISYHCHMFHKGDRLYFSDECTMPRVNDMYVRSKTADDADAIVLPAPTPRMEYYPSTALFEGYGILFVILDYSSVIHGFDIKDKLSDLLERNKMFIDDSFYRDYPTLIRDSKDISCVYKGPLIYYDKANEYIFKILDGTYTSIIFEDDLIAALHNGENEFTMETIDHLCTMLDSNDNESVELGLNTLAKMDYMHYPSIAKYILRDTYYNWRRQKYNIAIKFMLKYLDYDNISDDDIFSNVTQQEYPLASQLLVRQLRENINNCINRVINHTNLKVTCDINIDANYDIQATS